MSDAKAVSGERVDVKCRRCTSCEGSEHHWLDNPNFGNDPSNPDGEEDYNVDATHVCKHCPALGMECETCDGSGAGPECELALCSECRGEGVVFYDH